MARNIAVSFISKKLNTSQKEFGEIYVEQLKSYQVMKSLIMAFYSLSL